MSAGGPIGVVGGGLGGLAAAVTLAARGYQVILFERNGWLGGKASLLERDGFRFDLGPTFLTMPSVLARVFSEAGRELARELDLVPIDPQWRTFFVDGRTLDLVADPASMEARLNVFSPTSGAADGYLRFLAEAERLHRVLERRFYWRAVGSLRDAFQVADSRGAEALADLFGWRFGRTVAGTVRRHVREPRVAQALDRFIHHLGSAPDASPAVLSGLAHVQVAEGLWYPQGGVHGVAQALARLARELGVEVRLGIGVRRILHDGSRVTGVETDTGDAVALAAVVSNADAVRTHRDLLAGTRPGARFLARRHYEPACSGVLLCLGLDRGYEQLLHHNFVLSDDPVDELDWVFRKGEPAPDPTCYLCAPSRTDPTVAPPGGEALHVLVHVPSLRPHHDWRRLLPEYRRVILDKLALSAGLEDLEQRVVCEAALTPQDVHQRYGVLAGSLYGLASHGRILGVFKPGNRSRDLAGLSLAGGSAHPGPGFAMAVMSGWIAADALDRDGLVAKGQVRAAAPVV